MQRDTRTKREGEAGFTLIETLVAIVVLVFGLIAVTNLLLVGATNNTVANHGTAATTVATQQMEVLKAQPFRDLAVGGDLATDTTGFFQNVSVEGVGVINVRWQITAPEPQLRFIAVQAEGVGPMVRTRSRINLTTFRSCTADTAGCPAP
jgi:prepilin-type N-terminal cleavage/methylation domain-containing protein